MKAISILISLFVSSSLALAGWAEDFEILKTYPRDYQDTGAICEELGRLQVQREYPEPRYTVEVGIAYFSGGGTIGELDIVVFDNDAQRVLRIGEVKCWKDLRGGLRKAKEQRSRFVRFNNSNKPLSFKSTSTGESFPAEAFKEVREFFSMAQKGARSAGFDDELEYTLGEVHEHRKDMLRCQSQKICPR